MNIDKTTWDKVGSLVEATFVNIVQKGKAPHDFDLVELKSICYLEAGYLMSRYKQGAWALTTYIYEFLEKRVLARAYEELEEAKRMQKMLVEEITSQNEDAEEETTHHEYGEYQFPDRKTLADHLEDRSDVEKIMKVALDNDLGDIAHMLMTMTEREIADKLGMSQSKIHRKVEKLRELCREAGV